MAGSILWCFLPERVEGILGVVLWCSGLLMIDLPCIMGIWGAYVASAMLVFSVLIGQFLI